MQTHWVANSFFGKCAAGFRSSAVPAPPLLNPTHWPRSRVPWLGTGFGDSRVVARARALATSGPSSQSAPRTAMSAWGPAEEVDEGVERHGADWQGIKEPYQLELTPSMGAIRPWGHHAIRMKDAFWPWMAASCWTIQMPIWGESSRGEACPTMRFRRRP